MIRDFLAAEDGAITVDWVVISASVIGLCLAVISLISVGVEDVAEDTNSVLTASDIIQTSFLRSVTSGFTADATIPAGQIFDDLANATAFSFQMDATLGAGDEGILFEAGGAGHGTVLYQHNGTLYLQSGNGRNYGSASNRGEAVWDVSDGTYNIEGSLDANNGLALYIDGELVSQSSFDAPRLNGGNDGAVGTGQSSVAVNRGGFGQNDGHPGAGELNLFVDQTTGDETDT